MLVHVLVLAVYVVLSEVIDQDLLLLGVLVEVLLQALVRDQLLFELIDLLGLHGLVVKRPDDILHPRLDLHELLPEDGDALYHVGDVEGLKHLSLIEGQGIDLFWLGRLDQGQDAPVVCVDLTPVFFVSVVLRRGIKVHHIRDSLELRLRRVPCLQDNHYAELPDVEEVNQTFELVFGELGAQHEGFQAKAIQEKFDSVRLDDVIRIDQGLAFENTKL